MKDIPNVPVRHEQALTMTRELVARWLETIKIPGENFEKKTTVVRLNLKGEGYGEIIIKKEGDHCSKSSDEDRAWEFVKLYREFARVLWTRMQIRTMVPAQAPQLSLAPATAEEGVVFAELLHRFGLPGPKLIITSGTDQRTLDRFAQLRAEIYQTGHREKGAVPSHEFQPDRVDYDALVFEVFNARPARVYVPFGSGRLTNNFLYWQAQMVSNAEHRQPDPRLKTSATDVVAMSVCAGQPELSQPQSPFDPFATFSDSDIKVIQDFGETGKHSGRRRVSGPQLVAAYKLLEKHGVEVAPAAVAGMALYMKDIESGNLGKHEKVVVVTR